MNTTDFKEVLLSAPSSSSSPVRIVSSEGETCRCTGVEFSNKGGLRIFAGARFADDRCPGCGKNTVAAPRPGQPATGAKRIFDLDPDVVEALTDKLYPIYQKLMEFSPEDRRFWLRRGKLSLHARGGEE
jgi:hypothetical protein